MKKILIVGYFGFENFGDEWLLVNLIKLLRKFSKTDNRIYVLYNTKKHRKINDVYHIPRWNFFYILDVLTKVNTVIYCGGVFQDYTSVFSFLYYFFIFLLAKLLLKRVIILNTEFSFKRIPYFVVNFLCLSAKVIILRNKLGIERMLKLYGCRNKVIFCPDICYTDFCELDKQNDYSKRELRKIALIIKSEVKEFLFLINFCVELAKKYKLVFIPLHLKEDYKFCLEISKHIKTCEIRVWDKVENYKFMLRDIDLVITSRLHGVIMSDNLDIPFICFSNQDKIKDLVYSNYEKQCFSLDKLEIQKLKRYIIQPNTNKKSFYDKVEMVFKNLFELRYI